MQYSSKYPSKEQNILQLCWWVQKVTLIAFRSQQVIEAEVYYEFPHSNDNRQYMPANISFNHVYVYVQQKLEIMLFFLPQFEVFPEN